MNATQEFLKDLMAKIDVITSSQSDTRVDIAEIRRDIAHHIKRTDLAEENLSLLRADLVPVKRHVTMMQGGMVLLGLIGTVIGILRALNVL